MKRKGFKNLLFKSHGFTLFEMVMGIGLLSIIALTGGYIMQQNATGYANVISTQQATSNANHALRRIKDEISSLQTINIVNRNSLTFNLEISPGQVAEVHYRLFNRTIERGVRLAGEANFTYRPLLDNVSSFTFSYFDNLGNRIVVAAGGWGSDNPVLISRINRVEIDVTVATATNNNVVLSSSVIPGGINIYRQL